MDGIASQKDAFISTEVIADSLADLENAQQMSNLQSRLGSLVAAAILNLLGTPSTNHSTYIRFYKVSESAVQLSVWSPG